MLIIVGLSGRLSGWDFNYLGKLVYYTRIKVQQSFFIDIVCFLETNFLENGDDLVICFIEISIALKTESMILCALI